MGAGMLASLHAGTTRSRNSCKVAAMLAFSPGLLSGSLAAEGAAVGCGVCWAARCW